MTAPVDMSRGANLACKFPTPMNVNVGISKKAALFIAGREDCNAIMLFVASIEDTQYVIDEGSTFLCIRFYSDGDYYELLRNGKEVAWSADFSGVIEAVEDILEQSK